MKKILLVMTLLLVALAVVSCGGAAPAAPAVEEISLESLSASVDVNTVNDIKARDDVLVLDVREQWEYDEAHIPGVTLLPMNEVPGRLNEIPTDKTVIVTCRSGNRSGQVTDFLRAQGFDNVHNMEGGILAWQQAGLPVE